MSQQLIVHTKKKHRDKVLSCPSGMHWSRIHPSLDLYTYIYYCYFLFFRVLLIFHRQQCSFYTCVYIMPALKMEKIKNLNVLWMPEGPLLISTLWYRAALPNKLTPLASIELSWQQKKESHRTAGPCWMPCLWLIAVSYLLPCMKCEVVSGWDFHSAYVGFAVFNLLEMLCINWFALLDSGHARLFFCKFYHWWHLKSFTRVKPLRGLTEPFSYFPHLYFM